MWKGDFWSYLTYILTQPYERSTTILPTTTTTTTGELFRKAFFGIIFWNF